MKAKFITLEGIEGSGKSSNIEAINSFMELRKFNFINTREPGASLLGKKLRELLLNVDTKISPEVEMLLMLADRKDHVETLIKPSLLDDIWVISDRYMDSTIAYQGGGRELDIEKIIANSKLLNLPEPSLTLLFDLPVITALNRTKSRGALDRFEREPIDFHQRIRDAYLELSRQFPNRIKIIDSSKAPEEVKAQVLAVLNDEFKV